MYVHFAKGEGGVEVVRMLSDVRVKVVEYDGNHIVLRPLSLYAKKATRCGSEQIFGPS